VIRSIDQLSAAQQRRAVRLLRQAEAADAANADSAAEQQRRTAITQERCDEKQTRANDWSARFAALGLPITAHVQTNRYVAGIGEPEVWCKLGPDGEATWERLLILLEQGKDRQP
jgi:hypothetical protein